MESLLRWSIANTPASDGAQPPRPPPQALDPGIIDHILGRPDSELMKEDVQVATDASRSDDERVDALDHLEMLIELIDNANNLEKLNLWAPLHSLLTAADTPSPVVLQTLWVVGTALQNNPSAQDSYSKLDPLPALLGYLSPAAPNSSAKLRSKVIYTLSGLIKHNAPVVRALGDDEGAGWAALRDALNDPDRAVRRKTIFLLNALLVPQGDVAVGGSGSTAVTATDASEADSRLHTEPPPSAAPHPNSHASALADPDRKATSPLTRAALAEHRIVDSVVDGLVNPVPSGVDGDEAEEDLDFVEGCVR
ncbi:nucleotide exchange factor Fes1-domain-containing protein [Schizophyllum amplum]|uniref:Nucleotide exchange factor Fes1-domain-containing protein n=1 Tax=Schizophyllum amplum TaxID=97359 RepID=A0A550CW99_9AGAR|nr:nucleotide exchange factor Fes1-domain-containing protein [Auriculariopsis ampla]